MRMSTATMSERRARQRRQSFEGSRLALYRATCKWSQSEVAERIGVQQTTVSAWERGLATPSSGHLLALARLFRIAPEDFCASPDGRDVAIVVEEVRAGRA